MSHKAKIRLTLLLAVLAWLLFSFFDLYYLILNRYQIDEAYAGILPQVLFTGFILATFSYYRFIITKAESINFMDLLWRVFITGLVTTIISLGIRMLFTIYAETTFFRNPVTINFFYNIYSGLVVVYIISTLVVWKRLILYQKSKNLIQLWNFFEYALLASLVFDFLGYGLKDNIFNVALVFLTTFSLVLSFNLKWIAYLNFRQKWKTILFILLSGIYLYHFFLNLTQYAATEALTFNLLDRVFVVAILIFIFLYAAISILVTLFNLPTSSVFERKLQEAVDFQKLSQSSPSGQSTFETLDILIESSMSAVFADAAWIEIKSKTDQENTLVKRGITDAEVLAIKQAIEQDGISNIVALGHVSGELPKKVYTTLPKGDYRSIMALPLLSKNNQIGAIVLLQEVSDAFDREMVNIITTFVNQASVSLENAQLIENAIENERYQEQLKIAKLVQKSLLPAELACDPSFEITAYSMAADEVGGDYYDIVKLDDSRYGLIIGDVSGKGTSAAFNMAQMKGIFHSLVLMDLSPTELITRTNQALGKCLERSSFITASYYLIDTANKSIDFVRAGHCPTLIYDGKTKEAHFLKTKGLGLGIVRNSSYAKYVHKNALAYSSGDVMLLHTDGITEAMNAKGIPFGNDELRNSLIKHATGSPKEIQQGIIKDLHGFLKDEKLDDDYTLLILKFK